MQKMLSHVEIIVQKLLAIHAFHGSKKAKK